VPKLEVARGEIADHIAFRAMRESAYAKTLARKDDVPLLHQRAKERNPLAAAAFIAGLR